MISEGSAFLDRSGVLVAADSGFRHLLGLPAGDASESLRQRAGDDPSLAAFLAGEGPETVAVVSADGAPACQLTRRPCEAGLLLAAAAVGDGPGGPVLEYALHALVMGRLAGGFAHEVKNPLNAMALQLALLGDKIAGASEGLATACAGNLASIKNQIGRVNEVVRRQVDMSDPTAAAGFDAGALVADAASLFGHEARRRRIALVCDGAAGGARAGGDAARATRLVLGLLWSAVRGTPDGGRLTVRAAAAGPDVQITIEHTAGPDDPGLAWVTDVVAAGAREMQGGLDAVREGEVVRTALRLPKERPL